MREDQKTVIGQVRVLCIAQKTGPTVGSTEKKTRTGEWPSLVREMDRVGEQTREKFFQMGNLRSLKA